MNNCNHNIFSHILSFIHRHYRPFLRLVCKKWAERIKERECRGPVMAKQCKTMNLLQELETLFPVKNFRYIRNIANINYFPEKISLLEYLVQKEITIKTYLQDISDIETLQWLKSKNYQWPAKVFLYKYDKQVFTFLQDKCDIRLFPLSFIPLKDIEELNLNKIQTVCAYFRHGLLEKAKQYIESDNDLYKAIFYAIAGNHIHCVEYLLTKIKVRPVFYECARKNEKILDILLKYGSKKAPILRCEYPFSF